MNEDRERSRGLLQRYLKTGEVGGRYVGMGRRKEIEKGDDEDDV